METTKPTTGDVAMKLDAHLQALASPRGEVKSGAQVNLEEENELLKATLTQQAEDMKLMKEMMERQQKLHLTQHSQPQTGLTVLQPTPEPGTQVIFTNHAGKLEHGVVVASSEYDGCVLNVTGEHPGDKQQYENVKVGRKGTRGTYHLPTSDEEFSSALAPLRMKQDQIKKRAELSAALSKEVRQKGPTDKKEEVAPPEFAPVIAR